MPAVSPDAYGGQFGDALQQAAAVAHREGLQNYQLQREQNRDQQWTDFQHRFAQHRENMDAFALDARSNAAPGGAGHAAAVKKQLEDARDGLFAGITEKAVLDRANSLVDDYDVGLLNREADWQDIERAGKTIDDHQQATMIAANRARRLTDWKDYAQELDYSAQGVDGLSLEPDKKAKLKEQDAQTISVAFVQGQIDRDPQLAKAMIDKGLFDDVLKPEQLDALRNGADVEIRRQQAEADQALARQKAEFHQQLAMTKEAASQGIDVSADLPALRNQAAALGLPADALAIDGMAADAKFAHVYGDAPPVQREQRMADLAATAKPTIDQQRELKWLQDHQGSLDAGFNADPAGWAAKHAGDGAPPPLDFADPKSLAARSQWARAASRLYGRPVPPLTANEATQLRSNYTSGRAGAIETMDLLAQLPDDQAAAAARMVAPGQKSLAIMVTLPRDIRNLALDGRDALKTNKALLKFDKPQDTARAKTYDAYFGEALRGIPADTRGAVFAVAGEIAAGEIDRTGKPISPDLYWRSLNMALGADYSSGERKGGLAEWNDHWFLLPDGVRPKDWGSVVLDWAHRAPTRPVNPDGSAADLKRAFPVMVRPGVYEFQTDGGAVVRSNGVMGYPLVTKPDKSTWDKRADGSTKGMGWLGLLRRPDGNASSEISIGLPASDLGAQGKGDVEIPLMVPGLTKPELDYLMTHDPGNARFQKAMPSSIKAKAIAFAKRRLAAGKSPFRQDNEPAAIPPSPWEVEVKPK